MKFYKDFTCLVKRERKKSVEASYSTYLGSPLEDKTIPLGIYDSTYIKTSDWGH